MKNVSFSQRPPKQWNAFSLREKPLCSVALRFIAGLVFLIAFGSSFTLAFADVGGDAAGVVGQGVVGTYEFVHDNTSLEPLLQEYIPIHNDMLSFGEVHIIPDDEWYLNTEDNALEHHVDIEAASTLRSITWNANWQNGGPITAV